MVAPSVGLYGHGCTLGTRKEKISVIASGRLSFPAVILAKDLFDAKKKAILVSRPLVKIKIIPLVTSSISIFFLIVDNLIMTTGLLGECPLYLFAKTPAFFKLQLLHRQDGRLDH